MGLYRTRVLPWLIDRGTSHPSVAELRAELLAGARGRVLEIGFGPGASVEHYAGIEELVALDPSGPMLRRAARRVRRAGFPVRIVRAQAERIPFADASFDTVVSVLSLCSFASPARALAEVRRVLRPEGAFLFLEHGLAHNPTLAGWQRRLTPLQRRLFGCRLDLMVDRTIAEAGLRLDAVDRLHVPGGPAISGQFYRGVARHEDAEVPTRTPARAELPSLGTSAAPALAR
jgi:SAM-dependent methyltransferase